MKEITLYTVVPQIPERLKPLEEMARNIWFCWNIEAIDLFRSIDSNLWEETRHNPIAMLGRLGRERLEELLDDEGFLLEMDRIYQEIRHYCEARKPYDFGLETPVEFTVAYFSAEYGLTDCLPIYSGGLGVLSGDHLKSASDLCINMVGMGLLYQKGYFRQYLNGDGWQLETYPDNDFHILPVELERNEKGEPLSVEVEIEDRKVKARIWRVRVGRIPLWMLDTNTVENEERDRDITSALYGGDGAMRLKQEAILGIGGIRALDRLGVRPSVFHMNEGHSAFAILERIRCLMEKSNLSFEEAQEAVHTNSVFTTHTPVPAGIDVFDRNLVSVVLGQYISSLGISLDDFMALGIQGERGVDRSFNMAVLALKHSARSNGVSRLHGVVSRRMWSQLWPRLPEADVPIDAITNGIHIPSWISGDLAGLLDRYLGRRWAEDPDNRKIWERVERIPDSELWRTHERRRERLIGFARRRLIDQLIHQGAKKGAVQMASEVLNPEALTIGFARRFATYKRGDMILSDPERLAKILNDPQMPVQIIFAGKAHPQDHPGKEVIKNIVHLARRPEFKHRIVFIEDYDLNVARYLVQGVDVWLNNPRRPLEACGTSGMKAAANGALNLSILDGWWVEGYAPGLGWAIGSGEEYDDQRDQDEIESHAIYGLLEKEIVPLFYERGRDNLPREWIRMMKQSMKTLAAYFNSHRMVQDYLHRFYIPSSLRWDQIRAENFKGLRDLTAWTNRLRKNWSRIEIKGKRTDARKGVALGETLPVEVDISLLELTPQDLSVEVYYGPVDSKANFFSRSFLSLQPSQQNGDKTTFKGEIPCQSVGRFGFRIRVLPSHPLLTHPYSMGLILWG
ncbi:MAG: glycosyltransferase family 1 protein [Deltaproteobacteria bacterium]|nr:glycosyltransferase family 1 protein [Deltaproteobacteria bacterium]